MISNIFWRKGQKLKIHFEIKSLLKDSSLKCHNIINFEKIEDK